MLLFILWRDTTSELWAPVQFFYIAITVLLLLALFTFLKTITFYHSIRLIICSQQAGEIDRLIVSWGKVLGCVVCRFHVAASEKLHVDKYPGAIVRSVEKLAGINLRKCGSFSCWFDNLGFTTEGKLVAVLIINLLLGFSNKFSGVNYTPVNSNQPVSASSLCTNLSPCPLSRVQDTIPSRPTIVDAGRGTPLHLRATSSQCLLQKRASSFDPRDLDLGFSWSSPGE
jgi:hypothetical protein